MFPARNNVILARITSGQQSTVLLQYRMSVLSVICVMRHRHGYYCFNNNETVFT